MLAVCSTDSTVNQQVSTAPSVLTPTPPTPPAFAPMSFTTVPTFGRSMGASVIAPPLAGASCTLAWNNIFTWSGIGILYGNSRGNYFGRTNIAATNQSFTFTNLDDRLPWFFCAVSYTNLPAPEVVATAYRVNGQYAERSVTNYYVDSLHSVEVEFATSNLLTWIQVSDGMADVQAWGVADVNYMVQTGSDIVSLSPITIIAGTNGVLDYAEPATNGQRFFRIVAQ